LRRRRRRRSLVHYRTFTVRRRVTGSAWVSGFIDGIPTLLVSMAIRSPLIVSSMLTVGHKKNKHV
jgi:hypothetical protein